MVISLLSMKSGVLKNGILGTVYMAILHENTEVMSLLHLHLYKNNEVPTKCIWNSSCCFQQMAQWRNIGVTNTISRQRKTVLRWFDFLILKDILCVTPV